MSATLWLRLQSEENLTFKFHHFSFEKNTLTRKHLSRMYTAHLPAIDATVVSTKVSSSEHVCTSLQSGQSGVTRRAVVDPRGTPPSLQTNNFLISCIFGGKSGKFVCWRPRLEGWRPHSGILDPPLQETPPLERQTDKQTRLKTLPSSNFVCGR